MVLIHMNSTTWSIMATPPGKPALKPFCTALDAIRVSSAVPKTVKNKVQAPMMDRSITSKNVELELLPVEGCGGRSITLGFPSKLLSPSHGPPAPAPSTFMSGSSSISFDLVDARAAPPSPESSYAAISVPRLRLLRNLMCVQPQPGPQHREQGAIFPLLLCSLFDGLLPQIQDKVKYMTM